MSKYLIVGLGNIGFEYDGTRHNIGFDVVDALAKHWNQSFEVERLAAVAFHKFRGKQVILIKPTTYMNLSGRAVKYWMDKEKVAIENILVILDDLALPLSKVRLRASGSDAGHNGLKSIQESLSTQQYPKLRFGIGNNYPKGHQVDFVLGKWNMQEKPIVDQKINKCVEVIESFITQGIERTMNDVNKLEFN
ncbi:aminoacyl-tRNA hydrolase [Gynurincola endophyticus]|jgi:PTH1 family peptidyl-tRNA hydrolase|uniref:aminoacyl-tRNA hydrolase n=1 Tax=Gynurincola endophyticus TaxID=2479004 RepID=UPI000F8D8C75|nr:aminoacyl-tRNA hydrolase [Gynurincola endophyticus]